MKKKIKYIRNGAIQLLVIISLTGLAACNYYQRNFKAAVNKTDSAAGTKKADSISSNVMPTDTMPKTKDNDRAFLVKVAIIDMEEIQLGKLAQQKASSIDVRELGKMMEEDHHKAMYDLTVLAKDKMVTIPTTLADNEEDIYKKLSGETGSDFDKDYCDLMVKGHKNAIKLFEKESMEANDRDITKFALATLSTLHKHLDHATSCLAKCQKMVINSQL